MPRPVLPLAPGTLGSVVLAKVPGTHHPGQQPDGDSRLVLLKLPGSTEPCFILDIEVPNCTHFPSPEAAGSAVPLVHSPAWGQGITAYGASLGGSAGSGSPSTGS